jgi:hypothetical protein
LNNSTSNNNNNNNPSDLYSAINSKSKPHFDQTDKSAIFHNEPINQKPNHVPIYDSTTNIQHQRVQKNLSKFNNLNKPINPGNTNTLSSINGNMNNTSMHINQLATNRSKTPGPDTIYFRNNNNKAATISHANQSNGNGQYMSRSKTPTADMMFYPQNSRFSQTNQMFENIYQPFNNGNSNIPTTNYIDYNNEESFMNVLQSGGLGPNNYRLSNEFYTNQSSSKLQKKSNFKIKTKKYGGL